jgi:hypothetical protein
VDSFSARPLDDGSDLPAVTGMPYETATVQHYPLIYVLVSVLKYPFPLSGKVHPAERRLAHLRKGFRSHRPTSVNAKVNTAIMQATLQCCNRRLKKRACRTASWFYILT